MKKTLITLTLLCIALTLHALDYRQVIFGNSYENIIEVDAGDFFEQYEESVNSVRKVYIPEDFSYRVYRQDIGNETYFRILRCALPYSNEDMLDWKELDFAQYLFEESKTKENVLYDYFMTGFIPFNKNGQRGIEIIVRDNVVRGFLEFGNNSATYTPKGELGNDFYFMISNALIDSRRPFMYTIQNAFDGNPKTSYVEDTFDNMFSIQMRGNLQIREFALINGYADGDYYYQNNQVSEVALRVLEYYYDEFYENITAVTLADTRLFQTIPVNMQFYNGETAPVLEVLGIKQGTKFTDTCMAEFDVYIEDRGWLFGGLEGKTVEAQKTTGAYQYRLLEDNTLEITEYLGSETDITIPREAEYSGTVYPVTSIGNKAFHKTPITSLAMSDNVINIGNDAFSRCEALEFVDLSEKLTSIGNIAFGGCFSLESIIIPKSVKIIGSWVFADCFSLVVSVFSDTPAEEFMVENSAFEYIKYEVIE